MTDEWLEPAREIWHAWPQELQDRMLVRISQLEKQDMTQTMAEAVAYREIAEELRSERRAREAMAKEAENNYYYGGYDDDND